MTYIVAPTLRIGMHWASELGIPLRTVVSSARSARGFPFRVHNTIIIRGKEFDYPECTTVPLSDFNELLTQVRREFAKCPYDSGEVPNE